MNILNEVIDGPRQPENGAVSAPTGARRFVGIRNSAQGYGLVAISLHWLVAITVIGLFALGVWMTGLRHLEKIKIRALLVYGSVFGVAPRVTYNGYAPLGAP